MRKLVLLMMMFTCLTGFKQGNSRKISGTVYGNDGHLPIPGASVTIKGTATGTTTDMKGHYSINVPDGGVLTFEFVGYNRQIIAIGKKDSINVYLVPDSKALSEVMVTGYEIARESKLKGRVAGISVVGKLGYTNNVYVSANPPTMRSLQQAVPIPQNNNDESYKGITENGFNNAKDVPLSTFSVDVDGASYSNVRRFINNGQLPPADAVRIEEMVNYFNYNLPGPVNDAPVAIHTELSLAPWNPKHELVRIGLKAKTISADELPPSNLVFLLDVSGSMSDENKLPLVKSAMKMLVNQLRAKDKVAIVVYAGDAGLVLQPTAGNKKAVIDSAINTLNASGSTNGGEGIKLAYKLAKQNFISKGNNRIILATDGDFNVGPSSDGDMESLIVKQRESGVALSILGVGMGNYKDSKMETIADKGNGNYFYIDNITEARKALVSEFGGTLFTVAKDVKLQVEFNPAKVQAYRLLGYEDRLLNKEDFNDDKKDAGDMGSGHTVTALYEIIPVGIKDEYTATVDPLKYQKVQQQTNYLATNELMTVKFRYKQPESMKSELSETVINDEPLPVDKASVDFKFATSVAEFGMLLRNSPFKQKATYDEAIALARAGKGKDNEGYRAEFIKLAESAKLLAKSELVSQ